jgi:ATP-binding protein involved in chromosome partitioning
MLSGAIKQLSELTKWGDLDYLLIDMPPGTGDAYLTVASEIKPDGVILVTSNSKLAASDTLKTVQVLKKLNLPCMGFILNMADNSQGKIILSADEVEKMLGTKFLGSIPLNDEIKNFNFDSIDDSLFGIVDNVTNG